MKELSLFTRKNIMAGCIILALIACTVWWCGGLKYLEGNSRKQTDGPLRVVTSSYITQVLAREIGGDLITLSMLVPPGTEPHHFEPTPGSIIAVNEADLFIYVSSVAEPWVTDILKGLAGTRTVEAAPVEPEDDPHVWMTPYGALSMAKRIASALGKADPTHKSTYQNNLRNFEKSMSQLHEDLEAGLAACQNRDVIHVGHLAFAPLTDAYNLHLSALTSGFHQGEHSVYKLTGLVRLIRNHRIPVVFTEEMVSGDLARTIARETHVKILPLYTIEEVSKDDFTQGITYEQYMRRNLKNLQEGLKCKV